MRIFKNLSEWIDFRSSLSTQSIGFAPTMGNLHPGHLSLFGASKTENRLTVTSLFINPTQFNNPDDLAAYPRTLETDLDLLEEAGVDYCLLPAAEDMYPDTFRYQIHETKLSRILEGAHRPGHFTGMLTVVLKLLNLVRPERAYFGEKDYQQYLLIREMAAALFLPLKIIACPTVREPGGLAFSSRNNRLTPEQKIVAEKFAAIFHQKKSLEELITELQTAGISVEYLQDYADRRYAAVMIGETRLIDNYRIEKM